MCLLLYVYSELTINLSVALCLFWIDFKLQEQENKQRAANNQKPLPEEDINKLFKPLQAPSRIESLLQAGQINNYCTQIHDFAAQSLGKLFMSESLQGTSQEN